MTNDMARLDAFATPIWAALLSAQGKVLADMLVFEDADGAVHLDVSADAAAGLARRLTMFKLRRDVTVVASALKDIRGMGGNHPAPPDPRLPALGTRWLADAADTNATAADYDAHRLALGIPVPPTC